MNNRVSLFNLPLDIGVSSKDVLTQLASGSLLLTYLNPYAYSIAKTDPDYAENLGRFDLVVCDGIGVQIAVESVFKLTTPVISLDYSGIGQNYLQLGASRNMSLCLVGGTEEIVSAAAIKINSDYTGFEKVSAFGGFGNSTNEGKSFILESEPDLVLIGLGMGRQEAYLLDLVDCGWRGLGVCVGGFFDKLARPQVNYPRWSEKTRLRSVGRLIKEPRRLSKRYFIDYQPFIGMYLKQLFGRN